MSALISIIVPVFNVEKYLHQCVDSILAQTYTDFELLLINDGSTDNSGLICDDYAQKDARIRVFHKQNGGVSSARNFGLDNAQGEWIAFVDSDDYVLNSYLTDMVSCISCDNAIIISNYIKRDNNTMKLIIENATLSNSDMVRYLINNKIFNLSAPYAKLFSKNIIKNNKLLFPYNIHMGEDAIFLIQYLKNIETAIFSSSSNYIVNNTEDSLSKKYYSFKQEYLCFKIWRNELISFFNRFNEVLDNPIKIAWENRVGTTFNRCLHSIPRNNEEKECFMQISSVYYNEYKNYYCPKSLRLKFMKFLIVKKRFQLFINISNFLYKRKK